MIPLHAAAVAVACGVVLLHETEHRRGRAAHSNMTGCCHGFLPALILSQPPALVVFSIERRSAPGCAGWSALGPVQCETAPQFGGLQNAVRSLMAPLPPGDPQLSAPRSQPSESAPAAGWRSRLRPVPWWMIFLSLMLTNYVVTRVFFAEPQSLTVPYSLFTAQIEAGNVAEVTGTGDSIQGRFRNAVTYPAVGTQDTTKTPATAAARAKPRASDQFRTERPTFADPGLEAKLEAHGVEVAALDANAASWFTVLVNFGPTVLLIAGFFWISRRAAATAGGGIFGLGRSRAKRYTEDASKVTFDDVAGIDEAENELIEIVDFLKNPAKYQRLGGTVPKGVLLVGAPGTGKTLLARAIAGQAGVPFFSLSASEFIEMIVGVGASRVRDLFKQAREAAPAIVFIDELDAIGRTRGSGAQLGGHDEREQTLNQILTEMDGFDSREGVIVLAATNRADVLDQALLRPGRFDRRVVVQRPDRRGRAAILKVHTRKVPLASDVSLERIAAETPVSSARNYATW